MKEIAEQFQVELGQVKHQGHAPIQCVRVASQKSRLTLPRSRQNAKVTPLYYYLMANQKMRHGFPLIPPMKKWLMATGLAVLLVYLIN